MPGSCRALPEVVDDAETTGIAGRPHDLVEHVAEQVHHDVSTAALAEIPERKVGVCRERLFEVTWPGPA